MKDSPLTLPEDIEQNSADQRWPAECEIKSGQPGGLDTLREIFTRNFNWEHHMGHPYDFDYNFSVSEHTNVSP